MTVKKLTPMQQFDYSNDRLIVADMRYRDKSYIVRMTNYMNEQSEVINQLIQKIANIDTAFDTKEELENREIKKGD